MHRDDKMNRDIDWVSLTNKKKINKQRRRLGKFKKYKKINQINKKHFFFFFLQNQDEDLIEESTAEENRSPNTENENQAYKIY